MFVSEGDADDEEDDSEDVVVDDDEEDASNRSTFCRPVRPAAVRYSPVVTASTV